MLINFADKVAEFKIVYYGPRPRGRPQAYYIWRNVLGLKSSICHWRVTRIVPIFLNLRRLRRNLETGA